MRLGPLRLCLRRLRSAPFCRAGGAAPPAGPDAGGELPGGEEPPRRGYTIFIFCGASLVMLLVLQVLQRERARAFQSQLQKPKVYGSAAIGGPWALTDREGNTHSSADLAGRHYVIYFGFCRCPDICPQSLAKLARAVRAVRARGGRALSDLQMVFVSVDPDRDSPAQIRNFLALFDGSIRGVTAAANEDPALRRMLKDFKIYSTKIRFSTGEGAEEAEDYTLDHSVLAYLMSSENSYLTHLGASLGPRELEESIVEHVQGFEDQRRLAGFVSPSVRLKA